MLIRRTGKSGAPRVGLVFRRGILFAGAFLFVLSSSWAGANRDSRDFDKLPPQLKHAATLLEQMGFGRSNPNDDVAGRLLGDWGQSHIDPKDDQGFVNPLTRPARTAVNWGDVVDPETSSGPAGTNAVLLPKSWEQIEPKGDWDSFKPKLKESMISQEVNLALTILHEYVHVDQDHPGGYPQFEDPAWQKTMRANVAWMRNTRDSIQVELREPDSVEKMKKLESLSILFDMLRASYDVRMKEGLTAQIEEGSVSGGLDWPVLDAPDSKNIKRAINITNNSAQIYLASVRAEIARLNSNSMAKTISPSTPRPPMDAGGSTSLTLQLPGYWGHLSYTITGAKLELPTGSDRGDVGGRQYSGKFAGTTLVVAGSAVSDNESSGPGSGDYYELVVSINAGKQRKSYTYTAQKGEKLSKSFSLSVPIDPATTSGDFTISLLEQNRNYGPHGWVVSGSLSR